MKRNEVKQEYKWALEAIYASDDLWEKEFKEFALDVKRIAAFKGKLSVPKQLLACLRCNDEAFSRLERLECYANMRRDEDGTVDKYVGMCDRIYGLETSYAAASAYISPELSKTSDEYLETVLRNPDFSPYSYMLGEIKRRKKHILPEREEKILAMAGNPLSAFEDIFGKIDYVELPLPKIRDENGVSVRLTQGKYSQFLQSNDPVVRKHAFDALYKTYFKLINTITSVYAGSVKADNFYADTRGYKSSLTKALFEDNVPEEVYGNLISAVSENLGYMHEYVALRKQALGVERLHMYDMYVSIVGSVSARYEFEEAFDTVVKGLAPLGGEYRDLLLRAKRERWMDVYETENKRTGAYSCNVCGVHPFVLLNHSDTIHDLFTIAHELGHSIHSYYSEKTQPHAKARYSIFVAEVASTVNEVLLLKYLIGKAKDGEMRKYLLSYYLDMFRTTLFRQTMFAEFEKISHDMCAKGLPLTTKSLSDKYYKLNKKYYGKAVTHDNLIRYEWARIPHFYTAFYVYKYATGLTAAVNIAGDILRRGTPAVADYKRFLSSGGSDSPYELLKLAHVDLKEKEPFRRAMDEFKDTLEQLKKEF